VFDLKNQTEQLLKVLVATQSSDRAKFYHQVKGLASLIDRGLPRVIDTFQVEVSQPQVGQLDCLVIEKIKGHTLQVALQRYPQGCPEFLVLSWLQQVVPILGKLHSRRIIHGNLRLTSFIFREDWRQWAIADLGDGGQSAQALAANESTGPLSTGYTPPEQVQGQVLKPAADFYALGRIGIQLLTGQHPFALKKSGMGTIEWRQQAKVGLPLADLLDRLVQPDLNQRLSTAAEIQTWLTHIPVKAPPPKPQRTSQPSHSHLPVRSTHSNSSPKISNAPGSRGRSQTSATATLVSAAAPKVTSGGGMRSSGRLPSGGSARSVNSWDSGSPVHSRSPGAIAPRPPSSRNISNWDHPRAKLTDNPDLRVALSEGFKQFIHASGVILQAMAWSILFASIAAAIGFWLTYWSPLRTLISAFFAYQLASPNISLILQPALIVFGCAGLGTAWGLTQTPNAEFETMFWRQRFLAIVGYMIGWISWQWATPDTLPQAIARLTVFLALGLIFSLGFRSHLWLGAGVTALGSSSTFFLLMQAKLWQPGAFLYLFHSSFTPDQAMLWSVTGFFGLMAVVFSFWLGVSYYLAEPLLNRMLNRF
jgi:serine/threonine protein kinase